MTTTPTRTRERLFANPPGISVYSPPELGPHWGRRLLARMHRTGRNPDGSGQYDYYIVNKDGMFSKHPVKLDHLQCSELTPDPTKLWPLQNVPEDLKRAKKGRRVLPTAPAAPTDVGGDVQPVAEKAA